MLPAEGLCREPTGGGSRQACAPQSPAGLQGSTELPAGWRCRRGRAGQAPLESHGATSAQAFHPVEKVSVAAAVTLLLCEETAELEQRTIKR